MAPRSSCERNDRVSRSSLAFLMLALAGPPLHAQARALHPDTLLRQIEARGRALAAYDQAAWHGSDAVMPHDPTPELATHYIARLHDSGGSTVAFGRFNADTSAFLIAFEARANAGDSAFTARAIKPARADTGYFYRAARAFTL